MHLEEGEVLGLIGDNGAGKSTLIKILTGFHQPDEGQLYLDGEAVTLRSVSDARQRGIETVYQDLALINDLPVYLNMALKRESTLGWLPLLDRRRMRREARERLGEMAIRLPSVDTEVTFLSGGQRQAIAVARAVFSDAKVILLDEPLAAMGVKESLVILDLVRELKRRGGTSVIMIAHNYAQIVDVCDRVIALQHGAITYDRPVGHESLQELTELIASDYRGAGPATAPPRAVNELGYPRRGLHGRVVDELGRRVVGGRWSAGSPLPNEDDLAAELGVSRTVVREAIKVLQAKGLVEVRPKTGHTGPGTAGVAPSRRRRRRLAVRRPRARRRARRPARAARGALDDRGGGGSIGGRAAHRRAAGRDRGQRAARRGGVGRAGGPPRGRPRLPRRSRRGRRTTACSSHVDALIRVALEAAAVAGQRRQRGSPSGRGAAGERGSGDPCRRRRGVGGGDGRPRRARLDRNRQGELMSERFAGVCSAARRSPSTR